MVERSNTFCTSRKERELRRMKAMLEYNEDCEKYGFKKLSKAVINKAFYYGGINDEKACRDFCKK